VTTPRSINRTLPNPLTRALTLPLNVNGLRPTRPGLMKASPIENASPESTSREETQSEKMELMGPSHLYGRGSTTRRVFPFSADRSGRRHPILTANKRYVCLRNGIKTAHHSHH